MKRGMMSAHPPKPVIAKTAAALPPAASGRPHHRKTYIRDSSLTALTPLQIQKQRRTQLLKQRNDAASRIQRAWRRYLRSDALSLKRRTVTSAVLIQRMWRKHVKSRNMELKKAFEKWLVEKHRDAAHRWQFAARRALQYTRWARQKICSFIFAYYLRRKLLRRRQERMAVIIQRAAKGYLHRRHSRFLIEFAQEERDFLRFWRVCDSTLRKDEAAKRRELLHRIDKLLAGAKLAQAEAWQQRVGWPLPEIVVPDSSPDETPAILLPSMMCPPSSNKCSVRPSSASIYSRQEGEVQTSGVAANDRPVFFVSIPRRPNSAAMRRRPT